MKNCKVALGIFATVVLIFGTVSTATAQGNSVTNIKVPVDVIDFNGCTMELVRITGKVHIVMHDFEDNNGGRHISIHYNGMGYQGEGLSSGETYRIMNSNHAQEYNIECTDVTDPNSCTPFGLPVVFVYTLTQMMVNPGPDDHGIARAHVTAHVTVNANGETTADVLDVRIACN